MPPACPSDHQRRHHAESIERPRSRLDDRQAATKQRLSWPLDLADPHQQRLAQSVQVRENGPREEVEEVIARYRAWLCGQPELIAALPELRGKDLICWCAPDSCHADVLLELAKP
jgi:hypothetical protein